MSKHRPAIRRFYALLLAGGLFSGHHLAAQEANPSPPEVEQPTLMKRLAAEGHHNLEDERWNLYGQFTYIYGWKAAFNAPYTNLNGSTNSLLPNPEQSFTGSATLYVGAKPWHNGEVYFVPEIISEKPLSNLKGLGGAVQDFELQKGGAETPTLYVSRIFVRQTVELGGDDQKQESGPMQLGTTYKSHRLVFEAGNFSILDFFDKNAFDVDPRRGLFNLSFLTYSAYDFASNARGYSWGGVGEFYWDNWAVRFGRITPPKQPNQLPVDWRIFKYYGDQIEFEHDHKIHGRDGQFRVLGFRNHENIGRFSDAIAVFESNPQNNAANCTAFNYGSTNATAPDLCYVRKPNVKLGIGGFGEQTIAKDIGVFGRAMWADGRSEVDAYTSADRSATIGVLSKGTSWSRPLDAAGVGFNASWISDIHAKYLGMGGIDGFVGDGRIRAKSEDVIDAFYSANLFRSFWLSADFQHIPNPGFNADRGPVNVTSFKIHGEF